MYMYICNYVLPVTDFFIIPRHSMIAYDGKRLPLRPGVVDFRVQCRYSGFRVDGTNPQCVGWGPPILGIVHDCAIYSPFTVYTCTSLQRPLKDLVVLSKILSK